MNKFLLAFSVIALSGCGGNISGTYKGTETGTQAGTPFTAEITVSVIDSEGTLSGTWQSTGGTSGTLSGVADGETLDPLAIIVPASGPCPGTFSGTGTVVDGRIQVDLTGSSTCGSLNAKLDLTKQE